MIELMNDPLTITLDGKKLATLKSLDGAAARQALSKVWDTDVEDLQHYLAVIFDKSSKVLSDEVSFMTLSYANHGYIIAANETIDVASARKQIEIDLEIINRESQWTKEESIYFDQWWPIPQVNKMTHTMEFGVSLKDYHQKVFNRTINRIILTRYGHLLINYSLSEADIAAKRPLDYYQKRLDEATKAIQVAQGGRYIDVDEDTDRPSKSRMINLLLSSEIF